MNPNPHDDEEDPIMKAIRTVLTAAAYGLCAAALVLTIGHAHATGSKPQTPPPQSIDASAQATATATAGPSTSSVSGVSAASSSQGGYAHDQSRMWALPAPAPAAAIPGGLCIVSESMQASGLSFGYGKANSRTDMECLREWFKLQRELVAATPQTVLQPIYFPLAPNPAEAKPSPPAAEPPKPAGPGIVPKKVSATKPKAMPAIACVPQQAANACKPQPKT